MKRRAKRINRKPKDQRKALISKINARLRKWYAAGVSEDLVSSEIIDNIPGVTSTAKGYVSIDPDLYSEDLKNTLEANISTYTEFMQKIRDDDYNVDKKVSDDSYYIAKYNSRLYMNSMMQDKFKKYYDMVVFAPEEKVKTSAELKMLKKQMGDFARTLQAGDKSRASEIFNKWINPLMEGKTVQEIEEELS